MDLNILIERPEILLKCYPFDKDYLKLQVQSLELHNDFIFNKERFFDKKSPIS